MLFAVVVAMLLLQWHLRRTYGRLIQIDDSPGWESRRRLRRARLIGVPAALCVYAELWFIADAYLAFCGILPGSGGDQPCVADPTAAERMFALQIGPAAVAITGLIAVIGAGFEWYWVIPVTLLTFASMLVVLLFVPLTLGAPLVWIYLPSWLSSRFSRRNRAPAGFRA